MRNKNKATTISMDSVLAIEKDSKHAFKPIQKDEAVADTQQDDDENENVMLAAYLHDIDDRKYFNSQGCSNAVLVLQTIKIPNDRIQQIVLMI